MHDVIVIGGGVIGLTTAYELAGCGLSVCVLERGEPGREASWAGAGILPAGHTAEPEHPLSQLTAKTNALWPGLSSDLQERTGIDNGYRRCGGLYFSTTDDTQSLDKEMDAWRTVGIEVEPLTSTEIQLHESALNPRLTSGFCVAATCQVRNPRHVKALRVACLKRGVDVHCGEGVVDFERRGKSIAGVRTLTDRYEAGQYIITAGAWTQQLVQTSRVARKIEPVRGQILLLSTPAPLFGHVIECGPRYLVPRNDGLTLVGSTEEWVGFEKGNTPEGMRGLLDFAIGLVPGLADARFERAWSGLRPHSIDGLPLIGQVSETENLFVAAGHFRAGLHLSPITARLIGQLLAGGSTDVPLGPFAP